MSATSFVRGHKVVYRKRWVYADTGETIKMGRPCVRCDRFPTPEGYDACLRYIPGIMSACCGHGVEPGFIK